MQKQSIVIEPHKSIKEFRLYLLEEKMHRQQLINILPISIHFADF